MTALLVTLDAQTEPAIQRGVFSQQQAERGRSGYATHCVECHGSDLGGTTFGDGAPALKRDDFMAGRNLEDVFAELKRAMPFNAPGTLSDAMYLDVLAYVLRENGYPAGPQDLTADRERLKTIVIPRR